MKLLSIIVTLILSPVIAYTQSVPLYRLKVLEYEKLYEGSRQEHQKCTYEYYNDKSSTLDIPGLSDALGRATVQNLSYNAATVASSRPSPDDYTMQQSFDNNGRISTHSVTKSNNVTLTDTMRYNAHGDMISLYQGQELNLDLLSKYFYDSNNRLDSVSADYVKLKHYYSRMHYYYNYATGLLEHTSFHDTIPGFTKQIEAYYSYDNKGRVTEMRDLESFLSTPLDTYYVTRYEYNDSGDLSKTIMRRSTFSIITFYTYDASRRLLQKLNIMDQNNGSVYDTTDLTDYSYNSFNLPSVAETKIWSNKIIPRLGIFDTVYKVRTIERTTATYELFWPTAIDQHKVEGPSFTVYPVPSFGIITISAVFSEPQACLAYITDVYGRRLRSWNVAAAATYNHTLQLQDLPAGNYFITLQGDKTKMTQQFVLR